MHGGVWSNDTELATASYIHRVVGAQKEIRLRIPSGRVSGARADSAERKYWLGQRTANEADVQIRKSELSSMTPANQAHVVLDLVCVLYEWNLASRLDGPPAGRSEAWGTFINVKRHVDPQGLSSGVRCVVGPLTDTPRV